MQEQIQARLEELRKELEAGQTELEKVERQRTYLRETLLRIDGAIQALQELIAAEETSEELSDSDGSASDQRQPATAQDEGT